MDFQTIIILIPIGLLLLLVAIKKCKQYLGVTKTVTATLIDKYSDTYNAAFKIPKVKTDYFLAFMVNNQKMVFIVSVWVYNSYQKGRNGTLTYKNSRMIDFR